MKNSFSDLDRSGRCRARFAFVLAVALTSSAITGLRAQVVVVPNALATNDGDTSVTSSEGSVARVLRIFDASQFGALSGPSLFTQAAHRPDTIAGPSGPRTTTLRIYASTTSRSPAEMSTTFSENIGADNTLVFDGTVTQSTENLRGPGDTRQFDIVFRFTTPFLYDPAAGNLTLEFQTSNGNGLLQWDALSAEADPSVRAIRARSATAPIGDFAGSAVHQLTFAAPALAAIRTSQMEVGWNSQSNLTYQVQYRSTLTTNLWTSLVDCIRSTNSMTYIYDPVVTGQPQRFYRVVLANCVPAL